jgi:hypothetical protein
MKNPDKIELNKEQCDDILARLEANTLTDSDRNIITLIIQGYFWLQSVLQESKISISRIKSMFGFKKTESSKNLEVELEASSDDDTDEDILTLLSVDPKDSSEQAPATAPIVEPSNQNSSQDSDEVKKKAAVV